MFKILEPEWYYQQSQGSANILTNLIYLLPAEIANQKGHSRLSNALVLLTLSSSFYHTNPSRYTILVDRLSMLLVLSLLYKYLYKKIQLSIYISLGLTALIRWWVTDDISWWLTFQILGGALLINFLLTFKIINEAIIPITIYLIGVLTQLINSKYTHPLKHILTGIGMSGIFNVVL